MEILIVEDEKQIANTLKKNFMDEGHNVTNAFDGEMALALLSEKDFDIILLDWRIPNITGIEVLKKIRSEGKQVPVILLTALTDINNKLEALKLGADDYITKPFQFAEVLARIEAVMRRYRQSANIVEFDECKLNLIERTLTGNLGTEKLTEREFELLTFFINRSGEIVNKANLCLNVWNLDFDPQTNLVEVTVKNLRKKLENVSGKNYIRTIYGEGYLFISE